MQDQQPPQPPTAPKDDAPDAPQPVDLKQWHVEAVRWNALAARQWPRQASGKFAEAARRAVLVLSERNGQTIDLCVRMATELSVATQKLADAAGVPVRAESIGRVFFPTPEGVLQGEGTAQGEGLQTEVHDAPTDLLPSSEHVEDLSPDENDQVDAILERIAEGHAEHCAKRIVWGDGVCECVPSTGAPVIDLATKRPCKRRGADVAE